MSWNAKRYQIENQNGYHPAKKKTSQIGLKPTKHHVPPRSKGSEFIIQKDWNKHSAYHLIFGNAASYEECCQILKRDWWTPQ